MSSQRPDRSASDYLANQQLAHRLEAAIRTHLNGRRDLAILDVGAGEKPYAGLFGPYARRHIALDYRPRPLSTNVAAVAEHLPLSESCIDVVLATQVLEHVADAHATVSEWRRVLRTGGLVFASTHGTFSYHPDPTDYWRWTHAGLRKLFHDTGLDVLSLEACGGNLSTYTTLLVADIATRLERHGLGHAFGHIVRAIHAVVERVDPSTRARPMYDHLPGGLATNYLVVAQRSDRPAAPPPGGDASARCTPD